MSISLETQRLQQYFSLPAGIEHVAVPLVVANDYDATLGRTGKLPAVGYPTEGAMALLLDVARSDKFQIDPDVIRGVWKQTEDSGGSFDALTCVEETLPKYLHRDFHAALAANENDIPLLYEDAGPYLAELNTTPAIPNFTLTYGNVAWQSLKTKAAKIPGHVEITDQKKKGPAIEAMRGEDGTFQFVATTDDREPLVVFHADKVVLVDDKPVSFEGLSDDCEGIFLDRSEGRKKSQQGVIDPRRVRTVRSLAEIAFPADMRPQFDESTALMMSLATKTVPFISFAK